MTPRVRVMVVCDDVIESEIEEDVFTLENVRHQLLTESHTAWIDLNVFLWLSGPRTGTFPGKVTVISSKSGKTIRYEKFDAIFDEDEDAQFTFVPLETCQFPETGRYFFEVWFMDEKGNEVQKGEQPFDIRLLENEQ